MDFPISTGAAARLLSSTEPALNRLVRRGKLHPEPPISAGRRQWSGRHLLQAAQLLGCLDDRLRNELQGVPAQGEEPNDAA